MLAGRVAVPLVRHDEPVDALLDVGLGPADLAGIGGDQPLVFGAPAGSVPAGALAGAIALSGRQPAWLRLAPTDLDPATFGELARGAVWCGVHRETLVVAEGGDLGRAMHVARAVADAGGSTSLAPMLVLCDASDAGGSMLERLARVGLAGPSVEIAAGMPSAVVDRLVRLAGGAAPVVGGVLLAARILGADTIAGLVTYSASARDLTAQVAARLLRGPIGDHRALLGTAATLGYCHPRLTALDPVRDAIDLQPWWTPLADGWYRFEPGWRPGVLAACHRSRAPRVPWLGRLIAELVDADGTSEAIELAIDVGCDGLASDLLGEACPPGNELRQPAALRRWLERLPPLEQGRHQDLALRLREPLAAQAADVRGRRSAGGWLRRALRRGTPVAAAALGVVPATDLYGWVERTGPLTSDVTRSAPSAVAAPAAAPPSAPPARSGAASTPAPDRAPTTTPHASSPPHDRRGVIEARLLGSMEILIDGRPVECWKGRIGRMLLARLLLECRPHGRDGLAELFWPGAEPAAARNRLNVTMHALRNDLRRVTSEPVVVLDHGYTIAPAWQTVVDADKFVALARAGRERGADRQAALGQLERALTIYRGDLLAEFPYEEWTLPFREHYRIELLDVLGDLTRLTFDDGDYRRALEFGQRLLGLDFCREDLHRLLMRAHSRLGQPHHALRQYRVCERQLRSDFDVEPDAETRALYDAIRQHRTV